MTRRGCGVVAELILQAGDAAEFARQRLGFDPDAKQDQVLRSRARRLILNCSRQWGKSTVTAAKAVHEAWSKPGSLTLVASPSERQSAEFIRKARGFTATLGMPARGDGSNRCSIALKNESRIVGLPASEGKVRGFSKVSLLVVDEASRVPDDLYRALCPMLAVSDGDIWMMSTPLGQRGFFWETWSRGGEEWMRVEAKATECPRIPASFLAQQRQEHPWDWYRQEYLCEFVEGVGGLFDRELVEAALTDEFKEIVI